LNSAILKTDTSKKVSAAVSAAAVGDTIVVYPGTYREQIIISKNNITLKGSTFPSKNPFQNTAVLIHALYASDGVGGDGSGKTISR
jgi:pectinesterase